MVLSKDVDYVVSDDQVIIVDPIYWTFNGRHDNIVMAYIKQLKLKKALLLMKKQKRWQQLHSKTYLECIINLSGMTGTAKTEEEEFRNIYNMYVIQIPTNKPVVQS